MSNVNLPSSVAELTSVIKLAIEAYQQSPVKNLNKLNESVSVGLGFTNYYKLVEAAKGDVPRVELAYYDAVVQLGSVYIRQESDSKTLGVRVPNIVFDQRLVPYRLEKRIEQVMELRQYIAEGGSATSIVNARRDIAYLQSIEDEYTFACNDGADYVAASEDPVMFDSICDDILSEVSRMNKDNSDFLTANITLIDAVGYSIMFDYLKDTLGDVDDYVGEVTTKPMVVVIPEGGCRDYAMVRETAYAIFNKSHSVNGDEWREIESGGVLAEYIENL